MLAMHPCTHHAKSTCSLARSMLTRLCSCRGEEGQEPREEKLAVALERRTSLLRLAAANGVEFTELLK